VGFTKEKALALVAVVAAALVLLEVRRPKVEEVPAVPAEEPARPWRAAAAAPRLQPEKGFRAGLRDPFHVEDPWVEAPPSTLALPPGTTWPRVLPVGLLREPASVETRRSGGLPTPEKKP
jgi:hypothetical protein